MRIVALADTHSQHRLLKIPEGDVLIHAGDLTARGTITEIADALEFIRHQPHRHKIVVAGNHDFGFQERFEKVSPLLNGIRYLLDSATTIEGVKFWGSPWQPWFGGWAFNLQRGPQIRAKWDLIPEDTQVLVTHGPPLGYGDLVEAGRREGCADLLEVVQRIKPAHHIFGHIHEEPGCWQLGPTTLRNVTTDYGRLPVTVFDL